MTTDRPTPSVAPSPARLFAFVAIAVVCLAAAGVYTWWALRERSAVGVQSSRAEQPLAALPAAPYMLLRVTGTGPSHGRLALETPWTHDDIRHVSQQACDRVHAAAGKVICLESRRGVITTYHAHLLDAKLEKTASFDLAGPPSRARISADGTRAAFTVFVSGHSYASAGFSTRTSIVDVANGRLLVPDLEAFSVDKDGQPFKATDFNFWGVTFTPAADTFYATLQSAGQRWLVRGDIAQRKMTVIAPNVECPSLSPDGTRVAFKRRIEPPPQGRVVWRVVVRDLASGQETPLEREARNVDDQVEWSNEREVVYALPDDVTPAATNIWALAADNSAAPRLLIPLAYSPAMVR